MTSDLYNKKCDEFVSGYGALMKILRGSKENTGEERRKGGRGNKERMRRGDSVTAEEGMKWVGGGGGRGQQR